MTYLISLAQAKAHLRVENTDLDYDISLKIDQASRIVMEHMKLYSVPAEWLIGSPATTISAPGNVQAATCLILGELFLNRESSASGDFVGSTGPLSNAVKSLIERPPTLA